MDFIEQMKKKAKSDKKRIVLPEALDLRVIQAASAALKEGISDIILIGNQAEIKRIAGAVDLTGAIIIDSETAEKRTEYGAAFYELRKAKGITLEQAKEIMKDPVYFGIMMLQQGDADGLISGAVHSTADTLRPALQIVKAARDAKLVSSFFIMDVPNCEYGQNGVLLFSDCALNEDPDAEKLSEIAIASARTMKRLLGIEPIVAMLSYSTFGSAKSILTKKVVEATKLAKQKAPDLMIDGEMQVDAALVQRVADLKHQIAKLPRRQMY